MSACAQDTSPLKKLISIFQAHKLRVIFNYIEEVLLPKTYGSQWYDDNIFEYRATEKRTFPFHEFRSMTKL